MKWDTGRMGSFVAFRHKNLGTSKEVTKSQVEGDQK